MEDDDDMIVEEIPVYLSSTLVDNLFIFQYPIKNNQSNFDNADVVNCCIKPVNQQVKIDFALNTRSKNYDSFRGEQLALAADGKHQAKNERPTFPSGTMDKQSYYSMKPSNNVNKYVIGILQDREVHSTPIKGILQMRPSFSYFDKLDNRDKAEQKAEIDADAEEDELKQVTVKFARTENDKMRKAREKSFNYISSKGSEEAWCETLWHPKHTTTSELERQKLFSTKTESTGHSLSLTGEEYLNTLISRERLDDSIKLNLPTNVISLCNLKELPLVDQITNILKDARMVTFQQLLSILGDKTLTEEKVLRTLPSAGLMIRGNWVAQSEFVYPADSVSGINGVPAELMCKARDYVLYQLTKHEYVNRKIITTVTQLPPEEVKEILQSVAKLTKHGWELLLLPDPTFEKRNPELVQRNELFWRSHEEKFKEMESVEKVPKRARKKSIRESKNLENKMMTNGS